MAKKKPDKTPEIPAPENKESRLPISSMLINQITEFSPDGFFLLVFSPEGEPKTLEISSSGIAQLALDHALAEIVEEKKFRQEVIMENRVYAELDGDTE